VIKMAVTRTDEVIGTRKAGERPASGDRERSCTRSGWSCCPCRYLPADLPPWQTVCWYFVRWEDAGVTEKLLATLRVKAGCRTARTCGRLRGSSTSSPSSARTPSAGVSWA
jgi:transposase